LIGPHDILIYISCNKAGLFGSAFIFIYLNQYIVYAIIQAKQATAAEVVEKAQKLHFGYFRVVEIQQLTNI